jgi:hypothetical protein
MRTKGSFVVSRVDRSPGEIAIARSPPVRPPSEAETAGKSPCSCGPVLCLRKDPGLLAGRRPVAFLFCMSKVLATRCLAG